MPSLLIVNPRASGVTAEITARVRAALPDDLEIRETQGPGTASTIAREHEPDVDAIYVFSGDGTYNEVLNGVSGSAPLGFLPGGGTSVLPRALGLGRDAVTAASLAARGTTRRIGLGRVNGRRFGFNAGIGFDAELVRRIDERGRAPDGRRPGDFAFVRVALGLLAGRRASFPERLEVDGSGRAAFALVANCNPYTYAGALQLRVSREASFERGLDLVAPRAFAAASLPRVAVDLVRGTPSESRFAVVRDADRIVVRCDEPLPLQVDGEDLGDVEVAVFEAERDAVTALVPA